MTDDLVRTLETRYIYTAEQAAQKVKGAKGYVHISMESKVMANGSKLWRVVGYRRPGPKKVVSRRGLFGRKVVK